MKGVTERDETTSAISVSNSDNVPQFEEQREKFKKEARRLRKLKNEHIVKVHDLFEENGTAYYVMDFIDGESLAERLKRTGTAMKEEDVKSILTQILDALKEVHQNEIWHLDLKPGNIMIDKRGDVYLIDFGASKQLRANGSMTTSTALCYTPGYAPNEQIGQMYDRFGPWTDIYALGATIYNLLTNKKPPMAIDIDEDEEDAFVFPNDISEAMRKLVVWMMKPKRKTRPQSVQEIKECITRESSTNAPVSVLAKDNVEQTIISSLKQDVQPTSEETLYNFSGVSIGNNTVAKAIDLGLSVLWADCNVGGESGCPVGGLYGWGDPTGEKTSQNIKDYVSLVEYITNRIPQDISGTIKDIATVQWGCEWRIPTREHWKELMEKCKWIKTTKFHVEGYEVEGPNGNNIFLPTTGVRFKKAIFGTETGYYWTSELVGFDRKKAYSLYFDTNKSVFGLTNDTVSSGLAVRPICIKECH